MRRFPHLLGRYIRAGGSARPSRYASPSCWQPCRWASTSASGSRWSTSSASAGSRCGSPSWSDWTRTLARRSTTRPCWSNVGCHTDAHEQAHWFGDDIALKATKYGPEPFSGSGRAGHAPASRLRQYAAAPDPGGRGLRILGAQGGRRDARPPRRACPGARARSCRCGADVLNALANSYERWDGKGYPSGRVGDEVPLAVTHRAAGRVPGGGAPDRRHRRGPRPGPAPFGFAVRPGPRRGGPRRRREGVPGTGRDRLVGRGDRR